MAEFFDSKEEVLDIEITQWGKYLLSRGKFKPKFYSFSDDDVLYDGRSAGFTNEEQKDIENRILNLTPYIKTNTRLKEAKDYFDEYDRATEDDVPSYANPLDSMTDVDLQTKANQAASTIRFAQDARTKEFAIRNKLGTVRTQTRKSPNFKLMLLSSELSSSYNTSRNTNYGDIKIPQVNVSLEQKVGVLYTNMSSLNSETDMSTFSHFNNRSSLIPENGITSIGSSPFQDGTQIVTNPKFIALDLSEDNVEYDNLNFKIEFFEVIDENTLELKQLKTLVTPDNVNEEGFLIENGQALSMINDAQSNPDPDTFDYYFNMQLDSEIPKETICSLVGGLQQKGYNFKLNYDIDCGIYKGQDNPTELARSFAYGDATTVVVPASNCSDGGGECL